jgi:hypothetical protein
VSVVGVYQYYDAPAALKDEMVRVRTEAVVAARTGDRDEAALQLERLDALSRRAEVGFYLREWKVDPTARRHGEDLRLKVESLRDAVRDRNVPADEIKKLVPPLEESVKQFWRTFVDRQPAETAGGDE